MPTICSACGRTSGKCESCTKVDAIIDAHENQTARIIMRRALKAMTPDDPGVPAAPPPGDAGFQPMTDHDHGVQSLVQPPVAPTHEPEPYRSGGGGEFGGAGASASYESSCGDSSSSSDSGSCSSSD